MLLLTLALALHNPPTSILSRTWMGLAEECPIGTSGRTAVSIRWDDGAYYMLINRGEPQHRWKVMLVPPIQDKGWTVRLLGSTFTGDILENSPHEGADPQNRTWTSPEAWTGMFAKVYSSLPSFFTDMSDFTIRAIPEEDGVAFFFEHSSPVPGWLSFKVDKSWKLVELDRGF